MRRALEGGWHGKCGIAALQHEHPCCYQSMCDAKGAACSTATCTAAATQLPCCLPCGSGTAFAGPPHSIRCRNLNMWHCDLTRVSPHSTLGHCTRHTPLGAVPFIGCIIPLPSALCGCRANVRVLVRDTAAAKKAYASYVEPVSVDINSAGDN